MREITLLLFPQITLKIKSKVEEWQMCVSGMTSVQQSSVPMATTLSDNTLTDVGVLEKCSPGEEEDERLGHKWHSEKNKLSWREEPS